MPNEKIIAVTRGISGATLVEIGGLMGVSKMLMGKAKNQVRLCNPEVVGRSRAGREQPPRPGDGFIRVVATCEAHCIRGIKPSPRGGWQTAQEFWRAERLKDLGVDVIP